MQLACERASPPCPPGLPGLPAASSTPRLTAELTAETLPPGPSRNPTALAPAAWGERTAEA
eukprot:4240094-Pyramimonas_sp.AAC.1